MILQKPPPRKFQNEERTATEHTNAKTMTDIDNTDDLQTKVEEQQQRIKQLEAIVSEVIPDANRRSILRAAGAAGTGAVLGSLASGSAFAGNNETGTIGTTSARVDLKAEDIDAKSISTEKINNSGSPIEVEDTLSQTTLTNASTTSIIEYLTQDDAGGSLPAQTTDGVGQTETVILSPTLGAFSFAAVAVTAYQTDGDGIFGDFLIFGGGFESPSVINSLDNPNADPRSYSRTGKALELAMDAGSYDVRTTAIVAQSDLN